jgi:hypothetical protein
LRSSQSALQLLLEISVLHFFVHVNLLHDKTSRQNVLKINTARPEVRSSFGRLRHGTLKATESSQLAISQAVSPPSKADRQYDHFSFDAYFLRNFLADRLNNLSETAETPRTPNPVAEHPREAALFPATRRDTQASFVFSIETHLVWESLANPLFR